MRQSAKKILALALCACFLAAFLIPLSAMTAHGDHDCLGEECEICLHLHNAQRIFRFLSLALACQLAVLLCTAFSTYTARQVRPISTGTPVALKVRLNN